MATAVVATGGTLILGSCTSSSSKSADASAVGPNGAKLPAIEGGTVVTDPAQFPKKFSESPEFSKLVSAGQLPPVAERVGQDPLVIKPVHEIGKYGGQIRRGFQGVGDFQNANRFCAGPDNLLYFDYQHKEVVPNIAKGYELSQGDTVMTLHLRRGMKWSDGQPFTADDIIFWREDISLNPDLGGPGSESLRIQNKNVKVVKVDDYTVQYVSPVPNPLLPKVFAGLTDIGGMAQNAKTGGGGYAPKHYLSKFHPKYTPQAQVDKQAAAGGIKDWAQFFLRQLDWALNPDLPLLTPWTVTRPIGDPPWTFEANPYSIWVDTDGNQLPYIHTITMKDAGKQEALVLDVVGGRYDFQDRGLQLSSLPVLAKNEKKSGYTVHRVPSTTKMDFMIRVNLAYMKDKVIGDLLRNVDFRRALSLGIDRDELNQTYFLGTSVPSATLVGDDSPYFPGKEWRTKWATHDPAQANQLLDKIGLTKKDSSGYRLRPDGRGRIRLDYQGNRNLGDYVGMGEMIKRQWQKIGIDMIVRNPDGNLSIQEIFSNVVQLQGIAGGSEDPFLSPQNILPTNGVQGVMGIPYAKWFASDGKQGFAPLEAVKKITDAVNMRERGLSATSEAERVNLGKQIFMMHVDEVWSIGVVGFGMSVYGLYTAKNNLGNVPARVPNDEFVKTPVNTLPMTFYYKT